MQLKSWIDRETASRLVLRLELPAEELGVARFSDEDIRHMEQWWGMKRASIALICMGLRILRIEESVQRKSRSNAYGAQAHEG
jgi:hypothetical protein